MKVETIYDHNPTPEEIEALTACSKEEYLKRRNESGDDWNHLCLLFANRGDRANLQRVSAKTPEFWAEFERGSYNVQLPS